MNIRTSLRNVSVATLLIGAAGFFGPGLAARDHDYTPTRHRVRVYVRSNVVVPQTISYRHPGPFGRFYAGRAFYRPHHHYHTTYNLPVVMNGRVVYRPYNYCRGQLYVRSGSALPPLAFNVVFGDNYDYDRYYSEERNRTYDNDYENDDYGNGYDNGYGPGR
jgi:hypothetical protein